MKRLVLMLLGALLACASPSAYEKGGLVPLKLDEAALSSAYAPRRIALLVGISEFQDPQWRALRYSEKDAADLSAALKDPGRGHFDQVRVLTRPEQTTRQAILAALRELQQEALRPDDVVVVYFSAHGTLARDEKGELKGKKVHRVVFYEITKNAIQAAIQQPRGLSMELVNAQQARRALDYLVGFNLSPLL
jgi:uncharacterized caspase-like protein